MPLEWIVFGFWCRFLVMDQFVFSLKG